MEPLVYMMGIYITWARLTLITAVEPLPIVLEGTCGKTLGSHLVFQRS